MKRYYSLDSRAMKHYGINSTKWMICENVHFICGISDDGYCPKARQEMADHHDVSLSRFKHIIGELVEDKLLKRNKKNHLKTTSKWHKIYSAKNSTLDEFEGAKNSTVACQKQYDKGAKNSTVQPIRENLERNRESKGDKKINFSLSKKQSYDNLSKDYKDKLKAKCLLIDGNLERYEDFITQLQAKGYQYKDFSMAYMAWDKDKAYQDFTPELEPNLGENWVKVRTGEGSVIAINTISLETKEGKVKVSA